MNFKFYTVIISTLFLTQLCWGQNSNLISNSNLKLAEIEEVVLPALDNDALLAEENARRGPGIAPKYAVPVAVDLSPVSSGTWEIIGNKAIWRLRISSKNAHSINLGFTRYDMPNSGSLVIYNSDKSHIVGPFSAQDNDEHKQLWTPIISGDNIIVEAIVDVDEMDDLRLHLGSINHDFLGFGAFASGSCNLDVVCGAADGWEIVDQYRDIINSVAVIGTGGGTFCTGFLINNANNDGTPFFMTADHCGINAGNAASLVTYWNFQNSDCRAPNSGASGGNGDGQLNVFNTGSIYRAGWAPSDFTLVELDDPVNPLANGFMAGYSLSIEMSQDTTIGIHHPSTDEKRISFEFDPCYRGAWGSGNTAVPNGDHIIVPDWDIGTTEGGSSGSPLFDKNKRVIGQLHGGGAACGNDLYDSYGWFVSSWEGGGTSSTSLKGWLDPDNIGITEIDGLDLGFSVVSQPSAQTICFPDEATFVLTVSEAFTSPVDLVLDPMPANGVTATFAENPVAPGQSTTLTFSNTSGLTPGNNVFTVLGSDGTNNVNSNILISALDGAPSEPTLQNPMDQAQEVVTNLIYSWDPIAGAEVYDLQISTDANFVTLTDNFTDISGTSFSGNTLNTVTEYYWRVRANNQCGVGNWSTAYTFETAAILCSGDDYNGPEVEIGTDPVVVSASQMVSASGFINSVVVKDLNVQHSYLGDLGIKLISPSGTEVLLVDRIGVPASQYGCGDDNYFITFDDLATSTADDLEIACPPTAPEYQPLESLSTFAGEEPSGEWTIEVEDFEGFDGGALVGFRLEICSSIPNNTDLTVQNPDLTLCQESETTFGLVVGAAYAGPVTITAAGIPSSVQISYSSNPADPGSIVDVTVQSGTTAIGDYAIEWIGNDGTTTGQGISQLDIIEGPAAFLLNSPSDGAIDVAQIVDLTWEASADATSYLVEVFEQGTTTLVASETTTNETVSFTLDIGGKYDWTVTAINDCDQIQSINTWSFDVIGDLSFSTNNNSIDVCREESFDVAVTIGAGYFSPAVVDYSITGSTDFTANFSQDLNNVTPGTTLTGTITMGPGNPSGNYPILFTINDGTHSSQTQLTIQVGDPAGDFSLLAPEDASVVGTLKPGFDWGNSSNSNNFILEVADDPDFNNIVISRTLSASLYAPTADLVSSTTYYWRVTSSGDCGNFDSPVYSFTTFTSGTLNLESTAVEILPNPFSNFIDIKTENLNFDDQVDWSIYSANGQLIKSGNLNAEFIRINTSELPAGIYFIEIGDRLSNATERILKL